MANVDIYEIPEVVYHDTVDGLVEQDDALPIVNSIDSAVATVVYYKMIGRDSACSSPTYHSWVVTGTPDFTAAQAGALPCGGPLVDIYIADSWT